MGEIHEYSCRITLELICCLIMSFHKIVVAINLIIIIVVGSYSIPPGQNTTMLNDNLEIPQIYSKGAIVEIIENIRVPSWNIITYQSNEEEEVKRLDTVIYDAKISNIITRLEPRNVVGTADTTTILLNSLSKRSIYGMVNWLLSYCSSRNLSIVADHIYSNVSDDYYSTRNITIYCSYNFQCSSQSDKDVGKSCIDCVDTFHGSHELETKPKLMLDCGQPVGIKDSTIGEIFLILAMLVYAISMVLLAVYLASE